MGVEVRSLTEKGVFKSVLQLPPGRKAIPLMWVYTYKYGPVGEIVNKKVQMVVLGNLQGVLDHGEMYSAVALCLLTLLLVTGSYTPLMLRWLFSILS